MITRDGLRVALSADIPFKAREWRNDKRIRQWCRQYSLIDDRSQHLWEAKITTDPTIKMFGVELVTESRPEHYKVSNTVPLVMRVEASHSYIGVCGLTSINRVNQSAEFSLYIAPWAQGKGYGKEALSLLLEHGFKDHNLNRIWGEVFDGNPARLMFEELGMKHEGTLRQSYFRVGKFIDSHIVGILRGEFHA